MSTRPRRNQQSVVAVSVFLLQFESLNKGFPIHLLIPCGRPCEAITRTLDETSINVNMAETSLASLKTKTGPPPNQLDRSPGLRTLCLIRITAFSAFNKLFSTMVKPLMNADTG